MPSREKRLPACFQHNPSPVFVYEARSLKITGANKAASDRFGYSEREFRKLKLTDFLVYKRNVPIVTAFTRSGEKFRVRGFFSVMQEGHKRFNLLLMDEPSGQRKVQTKTIDKIDKKEVCYEAERLSRIVHESLYEIYVVDKNDLRFSYVNQAALYSLGYTREEMKQLKVTDLFHYPDEMALRALLNALQTHQTDRLQLQLKCHRKDDSAYDADVTIRILEKDESFVFVVSDITSRLKTEKRLLETIYEKETLLKEIHHRVKNNLQLISSIIYLKMISLTDPDMKAFLEDTRRRIRSIALSHERLLQTEKIDKVRIADYIGNLVRELQMGYQRPDLQLEIRTYIPERSINLDTAIICGLIVNELVTNAIKHAFIGRNKGMIEVRFEWDEPSARNRLEVRDDGISLPENATSGNSFGMQLVDVFVKQLGGTMNVFREKGTRLEILFP